MNTATVENTDGSKQVWTAPTLTTLSLPLGTLATGNNGSDGGVMASTTRS